MQSARRTANTLGELLRPVENKKVARLVLRRQRRAPRFILPKAFQVLSTMAGRLHMTIADKVLAISLVVLSAALFLFIPRWVLSHTTEVEIHAGDKLVGQYSLSQDRMIDVTGPLGVTKVEVKNGRVRIRESPCPHGTCMHMGDFGSEGGVLACVPNKVVVKVGKERSDGLDAVTK